MGQSPDSPLAKLRKALRALFADLHPEVAAGRHVPIRARVLQVGPVAAGKATAFDPRYAATVQPLLPDGRDDPRRPVIANVAIQTLWSGPNGEGVFRLPPVGAIVRVAFDFGDASLPVIVGVLPEGQGVPDAALGELVIQAGPATWIRAKADGKLIVEAPEIWVGDGATEPIPLGTALLDWLNSHVHLGNLGAPTTAPTVPGLAAALLSPKHKVK